MSLQSFPPLDLERGIFRAWWFDPMFATVCFGIFVNYYWYQERIRGLSSTRTFSETVRFEPGPVFNSAIAYWVGIFLWKLAVPPPAPTIPDGIPHNLHELVYLSAEVTAGIVLYDAMFFFIHWAMHEVPCLRSLHRRHHNRRNVEATDVLQHSLLDGSLQVFINILVQRQNCFGMVKSRLARALHNLIVIWMLTESHTASPYPKVWRRWFVGVREHRLHHMGQQTVSSSGASYGKYHRHQQFFGYLDDVRATLRSVEWNNLRIRLLLRRRSGTRSPVNC